MQLDGTPAQIKNTEPLVKSIGVDKSMMAARLPSVASPAMSGKANSRRAPAKQRTQNMLAG